MSDDFKVVFICCCILLLPVLWSAADYLRQKVCLLWVEYSSKRTELYLKYPWLEPKWHKKKRVRYANSEIFANLGD